MLRVRVAQLALRHARLRAQARGARLREAEGGPGEREPPEEVVEVGVRGEEARDLEAGLAQELGEHVELVGEVRRVDEDRLPALARSAKGRRGGLPQPARDHHRVGVHADRSHSTAPRRPL